MVKPEPAIYRLLLDRNGLEDIRKTVTHANTLLADLDQLATDEKEQLSRTQASLRKAASAVDSARIDSTLRAFRVAAGSVKSLADDLRATSTKLDSLLDKASNGRGTTGRLMNDPGLYDDMRKSLQRIDSLMADFQKNPRKYIKLSIF